VAGLFHDATLVPEVHVDEAETLRVSVGPLEIVQQAPCMIAANLRPVGDSARELLQMLTIVLDALRIRYAALGIGAVVVGAAVFCIGML
jgi:hypothetical protein